LFEAVDGLISAFKCPVVPDHHVADSGRWEYAAQRQPSFCAHILKRDHDVKFGGIFFFARAMFVFQPLGFYHLGEPDEVGEIRTIWAVHRKTPYPARLNANFVKSIGKTVGPPPLDEVFGVGPCLVHQPSWCIQRADNHYFAVGYCVVGIHI
jgi:hypothetical protein